MHSRGQLADWFHQCGSSDCSGLLKQLLCGGLMVQCIDARLYIVHVDFLLSPVMWWVLLTVLSVAL